MISFLFYVFSALALASAVMVVTRKNPVSSALFLVLTFFSLAGIYVLMDAFFLAVVQVAVYAGAIMVLFLFVIMMLNLSPDELPPFMNRKIKWAASALAIVLTGSLLFLDLSRRLPASPGGELKGEVGAIGDLIFGKFLLPFELTAVLLLMAIVAAVIMARREIQ